MENPLGNFKRTPVGSRFFWSNQTLVVAVSTGVDSMCLLDLLQSLEENRRPQIVVAHVNHHLRKQSQEEEAFLRTYCKAHNLPLEVAQWRVELHPKSGIEEAARHYRYNFFARVMKKYQAQAVATAHHQDDLAETILMKLVRGGRIEQLVGLTWQRPFSVGSLIRPLLATPKEALLSYAKIHHLTWFEDETNTDQALFRNRVRHRYLPELRAENPQLVKALASNAEQLADLLTLANQQLAVLDQGVKTKRGFSLLGFRKLAKEQQRSYLRYFLDQTGIVSVKEELLYQLIASLTDEGRPPQVYSLPNQWRLVKDYQEVFVKKAGQMAVEGESEDKFVVELGQWYRLKSGDQFALMPGQGSSPDITMWLTPDQFPLSCRLVAQGDRLTLKGGKHQKVRRLLINQKVPRLARQTQRVVVDRDGQVVWVIGRRAAWLEHQPGAIPVSLCRRKK